MGRIAKPQIHRFMAFVTVNKKTGCWEWQGNLDKNGYGMFWSTTNERAHRWSYKYHIGKIKDGMTLDHLCRVKNCVNPAHLEPVTNRENIIRARDLITHCPNGHPYAGDNLYRYKNSRGCKICRTNSYLKQRRTNDRHDAGEDLGK